MTNSRTVQETFLGSKFITIDRGYRDKDGKLEKLYVDSAVDQKVIPIYKIEGHNVNTSDLFPSQLGGVNILYEVEYRLGQRGFESFVGNYIDATKDFRTLIFTHPTLLNMTIGIPIMNIYSCKRVKISK
jgi:hypothetical protein